MFGIIIGQWVKRIGYKNIAFLHLAAVADHVGMLRCVCAKLTNYLRDHSGLLSIQMIAAHFKRVKLHLTHHMDSFAAVWLMTVLYGASGVTDKVRRVSDTIWLNTGAATTPP